MADARNMTTRTTTMISGYIANMSNITDLLSLFDGFYPDFQMLHTNHLDLCILRHGNVTHRAPVRPMDQDLSSFATLVSSLQICLWTSLYLPSLL
jgi:hypothetical protein